MLLYAVTIFLSAFLLFQVQPMIAKIILPWFGGTAAVWTTCMLFFQVALLLGYLYAHQLVSSLTAKRQAQVHCALLAASLLLLHVTPGEPWKPSGQQNPALRILALLSVSVGLPFFLLSTTGPLLQAWYARRGQGGLPYRLFALSNAGSMLALLSYPALVEPLLPAWYQVRVWTAAYGGFVLLCGGIALARSGRTEALGQDNHLDVERPGWPLRLLWMALAACPSVLLLAVTNYLCQNVAPIPLLWVLPLGLYLLSFILCFGDQSWYFRPVWLPLTAVALGGLAYVLARDFDNSGPKLLVPLFSSGLFFSCMACHGELAGLKPHPYHLTSFYLMVSLGGALGGVLVGLAAPWLFPTFLELPIGLAGCALLLLLVLYRDPESRFHKARWQPSWLGLIGLTVALIVTLGVRVKDEITQYKVLVRNFYGVLRISEDGKPADEDYLRRLTNGTINHGEQFLRPERRRQPTTYYAPSSGVGLAILSDRPAQQRVGVIGLGAGVLASYGRIGDYYTFYEINPAVVELARTQFTFLQDCQAKVDVVLGDARLSLDREGKQDFDVLVVDAFASDSIPVHLLTVEAFSLYFRHLKPGGVLAVHISNKYLELQPVVESAARTLGKEALLVDTKDDTSNGFFGSTWALVAPKGRALERSAFRKAGLQLQAKANFRPWTDDYSSLFPILK